jgi:predicted amidohydrolase YtcJ
LIKSKHPESTIIILNANVITFNNKQPKAEAIAIRNEKIIAVGSNKELNQYKTDTTQILDLHNRTVLPGFVDCHVHLTSFTRSVNSLNLKSAQSIAEVQSKLRKHAENTINNTWILGELWDQEKFREKRYPTRWDLDAVVAENPVFLIRICGHAGIVNSKALQ